MSVTKQIPFWQQYTMTVEEASAYFRNGGNDGMGAMGYIRMHNDNFSSIPLTGGDLRLPMGE